jgi:hypothetical protein
MVGPQAWTDPAYPEEQFFAASCSGGVTMSFDTFTLIGILAALISGGFLIALVACNDRSGRGPCRFDDAEGTSES